MDLLISHNFRQEALSWPSSITYTTLTYLSMYFLFMFSPLATIQTHDLVFHIRILCTIQQQWMQMMRTLNWFTKQKKIWLCSQSQLWLSFAYPFLSSKLSLRDESWKRFRQIFGSDDGGMCTKDSIFFLSFWDLYYTLLEFWKELQKKEKI